MFRFNVLPFSFFFSTWNLDTGAVWAYVLYQKALIQALCSVVFSVSDYKAVKGLPARLDNPLRGNSTQSKDNDFESMFLSSGLSNTLLTGSCSAFRCLSLPRGSRTQNHLLLSNVLSLFCTKSTYYSRMASLFSAPKSAHLARIISFSSAAKILVQIT